MAKALALLVFLALLTACETSPDCEGCKDDYYECGEDAGWQSDHCLDNYCQCLLEEGCDCDYQKACE